MGNELLDFRQDLCIIIPAHHPAAVKLVGQVQSQLRGQLI
jgi:hypothetical protein